MVTEFSLDTDSIFPTAKQSQSLLRYALKLFSNKENEMRHASKIQ